MVSTLRLAIMAPMDVLRRCLVPSGNQLLIRIDDRVENNNTIAAKNGPYGNITAEQGILE